MPGRSTASAATIWTWTSRLHAGFVLCGHDDPAGVMAAMGLASPGAAPSHRHLLSHAASMVAVVTSIIGGVGVALAANAAAVGVLVTVACTAAFGWHQTGRRGQRPQPVPLPVIRRSQPGRRLTTSSTPASSRRIRSRSGSDLVGCDV